DRGDEHVHPVLACDRGDDQRHRPVAAEIMAGRPPRKAIEVAMMNAENRPTLGSTPAMIENAIASGMRARPTTSPARTPRVSSLGEDSADRTEGSGRQRRESSVSR